jgi:hypothetical protein
MMMQIVASVNTGIDAVALLSERTPALHHRFLSAESGLRGFTIAHTILERKLRLSHLLFKASNLETPSGVFV